MTIPLNEFVGIDYGAKSRQTTAVAYVSGESIQVKLVPEKTDPDKWLETIVLGHQFKFAFIDCPLSLPYVYINPREQGSYHYRKADQALNAMSPMLLGGLTARGMELKSKLEIQGVTVLETYPKAILAKRFETKSIDDEVVNRIVKQVNLTIQFEQQDNSHLKDALLAWFAGWQYMQGNSLVFGKKNEGLIYL